MMAKEHRDSVCQEQFPTSVAATDSSEDFDEKK